MPHLLSYLQLLFFGMHLCHIFTPHYLHICDIFAKRKFVQIHFLRPMPISLDYDFPGKEGMIHLVAINYILTLGLWGIF